MDDLMLRQGQSALTAAQKAAAEELTHEYSATILSTEPADEAVVERSVAEAYRAGGHEPPQCIRWFDSPREFVLARAMDDPKVRDSVEDSVRDSVQASVWTLFGAPVSARVRDSVWTLVGARVRDSVWTLVGARVRDSVRDSVWNSVRDSVRNSVWVALTDSVRALYDADHCAYMQYFHEHLAPHALGPFIRLNRASHGYSIGSQECRLVRHAVRLERDERGRLHSEDGMAIRYANGWGIYCWHGVRLSEAQGEKIILHPEMLTRADWFGEQNAEVRRVIQERLGGGRFVALVGATTVHTDECGELVAVDLGREDPERRALYVHVKDASTDRENYLRVPPTMERACQAVAWTFDIPEAEYRPLQES